MPADRRESLKIIGAISATCAFPFSADELYGQTEQHVHALAQLQQQASPATPRYFAEAEFRLLSRLADLILPETSTPGAVAAGVPAYIDFVVSQNKGQQNAFRIGAKWLDAKARSTHGKDFLSLTEGQQIALLTPLCAAVDAEKTTHDGDRFFGMIKKLTADGYFTSKIGLMQTLGYQGNAVVPDFKGCTHEH